MAMSKLIRKELGKLREVVWYFLSAKKPSNRCFFCKGILLTDEQKEMLVEGWVRFGNAAAPPLDLGITMHHLNGDHDDNRPKNVSPSHDTCHKRHHANLVFARINGVKPKVMAPADYRRAA